MTKAEKQMTTVKTEFSDEQRITAQLIGARIGRKQAFNAIQKLLMVSDLVDLQKIKESKSYKGYQALIDGKWLTISTFDEYCTLIEGRSRQAIDLDLANLNQLGEGFFDAMRQIGIGPSTMRDYRKLPDDEKQALLEVAQTGDKDSFVELATALITKHQKEKQTVEQRLDELTKTVDAKEASIKDKSEELDKKNELLTKVQQEVLQNKAVQEQQMPGEYQLSRLQEYSRELTGKIEATLRSEIAKLYNEFNGEPPQHMRLAVGQVLGLIITATHGVASDMTIEPVIESASHNFITTDADVFVEAQQTDT